MTWNVLRVRHGHEHEVAVTIEGFGEGFRSLNPRYRAVDIVRGRKVHRMYSCWSNYVLADWPVGDGVAWHRVMDVVGVIGVIGGEHPTPVTEEVINRWLAQMDDDGVITALDVLLERLKRGYGVGDRIRIEGGPFHDYRGVCDWFDARGVSVNLEALQGQLVKLYIPLAAMVRVVSDGSHAAPKTKSSARRARRRLVMEDRMGAKSRKDFVRRYS